MISGRTTNTRVGNDKLEYFIITVGGELTEVPMDQLCRMETITPTESFKRVNFQTQAIEE